MRKTNKKSILIVNRETIRQLEESQLVHVYGAEIASGSQGTLSVTCPPPKNGEGSGCVTA